MLLSPRLRTSLRRASFAPLLAILWVMAALGWSYRAYGSPPMPVLERVQGDVTLIRSGNPISPTRGVVVMRRDRLLTGPHSRAAVLFPDGSRLLLGANAEFILDDLMPPDGRQRAALRIDVPHGAFRLIMAEPNDLRRGPERQVLVRTARASVMLNTGDLWAGPLEDSTGVLAIYGKMQVRNDAGSLVLDRKRQGTLIKPSAGLGEPTVWPRHRVEQALMQSVFD